MIYEGPYDFRDHRIVELALNVGLKIDIRGIYGFNIVECNVVFYGEEERIPGENVVKGPLTYFIGPYLCFLSDFCVYAHLFYLLYSFVSLHRLFLP